ncbi:hypothetical protein SASPL_112432 [Salvia splendens]|uniref:Terpene synthase N-terminal domain-containing protein n=1 Tax=Salvia splendens TaxID=180675 RepID=A0A8X8Y8S2_SALSN|nr:hypothetical protein SASPL_112432 [Salvia splendens]
MTNHVPNIWGDIFSNFTFDEKATPAPHFLQYVSYHKLVSVVCYVQFDEDVFNKFVNEDGMFEEENDEVEGVLSLYEAAYVRFHDEDILQQDEVLLKGAQDLSCEKIIGVLVALPQKEVSHSFIKWRKENYFNGKVDLVMLDETNEKSNKTKIEFFFTERALPSLQVIKICRWNIDEAERRLPEYMRIVYLFITSVYEDYELEATQLGRAFAASYLKQTVSYDIP